MWQCGHAKSRMEERDLLAVVRQNLRCPVDPTPIASTPDLPQHRFPPEQGQLLMDISPLLTALHPDLSRESVRILTAGQRSCNKKTTLNLVFFAAIPVIHSNPQ
jgi:hypothetical protein